MVDALFFLLFYLLYWRFQINTDKGTVTQSVCITSSISTAGLLESGTSSLCSTSCASLHSLQGFCVLPEEDLVICSHSFKCPFPAVQLMRAAPEGKSPQERSFLPHMYVDMCVSSPLVTWNLPLCRRQPVIFIQRYSKHALQLLSLALRHLSEISLACLSPSHKSHTYLYKFLILPHICLSVHHFWAARAHTTSQTRATNGWWKTLEEPRGSLIVCSLQKVLICHYQPIIITVCNL